MFDSIRNLLVRIRRRTNPQPPTVEVRADGFIIRQYEDELASVRWEQVTRIATYKRDNVTTDEIMLVFAYDAGDAEPAMLEVSETWKGFSDFFEALPKRFPGLA